MLAYLFYLYLTGFAVFLLGLSIFMYIENRKFGDNQFTMKLLPPPARFAAAAMDEHAKTFITSPAFAQEEKVIPAFSEAA
jgi:hypothetical protein